MKPRTLVISAPGKTFLVGEYLALEGGPSLVLTTRPRFELRLIPSKSNEENQLTDCSWQDLPGIFPVNSPAWNFVQGRVEELRNWRGRFLDPHKGAGGLGASTAQFALIFAFHDLLKQKKTIDDELQYSATKSLRRSLLTTSTLRNYQDYAWNGEGVAPSGADFMAQMAGGISWLDDRDQGQSEEMSLVQESLTWPFRELGFCLIRTGKKLATHEHLRSSAGNLTVEFRVRMGQAVELSKKALQEANEEALVIAVRIAGEALESAGRVAHHTQEILRQLRDECDFVLAAKGCGAMGADVVLVLHPIGQWDALQKWVDHRGYSICGRHLDIGEGLSFESIEGNFE